MGSKHDVKDHCNIIISGIETVDLIHILHFLYSGESKINIERMENIISINSMFQIKGLIPESHGLDASSFDTFQENVELDGTKYEEMECLKSQDENEKDFDEVCSFEKENDYLNTDMKFQEEQIKSELIEHDASLEDSNVSKVENCITGTEIKNISMENVKDDQILKGTTSSSEEEKMLEKIDGLWECKLCGKASVKKSHAIGHIESHLKHKKYPCEECGKILRTSSSYRNHMIYIHSDELFTCDNCGESGMPKKKFKNHRYVSKTCG